MSKKKSEAIIVCLVENTTGKDYGLFTDKIIYIQKDDQVIILEPEDLRKLENVMGCGFKC